MAVALLFPTGILTSFLGTAIPESLVKTLPGGRCYSALNENDNDKVF